MDLDKGEEIQEISLVGTGKSIYRTNNIRVKLTETSEYWTGMCNFVKNVMMFLREFCLVLFEIG